MYHWTVIIILIFSYSNPGHAVEKHRKWFEITKDLEKVYEELKKSKYWNYHRELQLYTASASSADTCENSVLDCYVTELLAILEELELIKEPNDVFAKKIEENIYNILINAGDTSVQNVGCKKCEEYEEKPLEKFIEGFTTLLQKMQNL